MFDFRNLVQKLDFNLIFSLFQVGFVFLIKLLFTNTVGKFRSAKRKLWMAEICNSPRTHYKEFAVDVFDGCV